MKIKSGCIFLKRGIILPAGNISGLERLQRMHSIKELLADNKSDSEIAQELGMSLDTVKRNKKWLEDVAVADLTSKEIGEKRAELYLELLEAAAEAQALFEKHKDSSKTANTWMLRWIDTIKLRSELYGLNNIKVGALVQINNQNPPREPEKVSAEEGEKISNAIKNRHFRKLEVIDADAV